MPTVTRGSEANAARPVLHVALELGDGKWRMALTTGLGRKPRQVAVPSRDLAAVLGQIRGAKRRFGLAEDAPVVSCYEAGLDGFWLHRALRAQGVENHVVDSSSIDVKRRKRRAKTDRLDAAALVRKLVQYVSGDRHIWSVVHVPPENAEDLRHNERELIRLTDERTAARNQIKGLLKTEGIRLERLTDFAARVHTLRRWDGSSLGPELLQRLLRVWERLGLIEQQIREVRARREELMAEDTKAGQVASRLVALRALGPTLSWQLTTEIFGWRRFRNRRQLGGLVGLVPVPAQSGASYREHGISKAGRGRLRASLIEMAWLWLRYQPSSALAQWYREKYAGGGKRLRRIGIVALARKLLIELWKYVETGVLPAGAEAKA